MQKRQYTKVSLIGPSGVGKSSIIKFLLSGTFNQKHITTIGIDFNRYILQKDKCFQLWDNPGQQRHRKFIWEMNKRFAAFIFIFDLSDGESFSQINEWFEQIQQKVDMHKIVLYAFGNKADKPRKIQRDFIENFWAEKGIQYNEISLVNNANTKKIIDRVLGQIWYKIAYLESQRLKEMKQSIRLEEPLQVNQGKRRKKCC